MRTKKDVINRVVTSIREEKSRSINRDSLYSRGLAWEGYDGGYIQALLDVLLFMNNNIPNSRYEYIWHEILSEYWKNQ